MCLLCLLITVVIGLLIEGRYMSNSNLFVVGCFES